MATHLEGKELHPPYGADPRPLCDSCSDKLGALDANGFPVPIKGDVTNRRVWTPHYGDHCRHCGKNT
jgi:hypothetical protein